MTRAVLVVVCILFVLLLVAGMRWGWRNRMARQSELQPLPVLPTGLSAPTLESTGLYVGTTFSSSWQDRVVHGGLGDRADAIARLHEEGLELDRQGTDALFVPASSWVEARLAPGLAGKVVGAGGLLVVRWRLGDALLDTAFRADDKTTYPDWVNAINEKAVQA